MQNIWQRLGKCAATLTSHSFCGDTQNNCIHWAHKHQHLSSPQGRARGGLATSRLEYEVNTGHIPSTMASGKICILIFSSSTYHQRLPFFVMTPFITVFTFSFFFVCSLKDTCAQSGFTFSSYLRASFLLRKLWGTAGAVRAFRYRIGHEDYIHTRLNNRHCLLGILTIISLVLPGCGTKGAQGVLTQRRGSRNWEMSSLWTRICHVEINSACQASVLQNIRCLECTVKKHSLRHGNDCFVSSDWFRNTLLLIFFCFILHPWPQCRSLMCCLKVL